MNIISFVLNSSISLRKFDGTQANILLVCLALLFYMWSASSNIFLILFCLQYILISFHSCHKSQHSFVRIIFNLGVMAYVFVKLLADNRLCFEDKFFVLHRKDVNFMAYYITIGLFDMQRPLSTGANVFRCRGLLTLLGELLDSPGNFYYLDFISGGF